MSFAAKLVKSGSTPIYLVTCKDPSGRNCFYFVISNPRKMSLLAKIKDGFFNINDYGKIIASGFGDKPSEEVLQRLKLEYNFDFEG